MRQRFVGLICTAAVTALVSLPAIASQAPSGGTAGNARSTSAICGTWKLASWVRHTADGRALPYDPVVGILFYDQLRNMSVQITATDPTNASASSAADRGPQTYTAYFGTYTIDEAKHTVTHHIRANRSGSAGRDAVRLFELNGDRLTLRVQADADGLTHVLVWQRAR
jgi:hypothetical protein